MGNLSEMYGQLEKAAKTILDAAMRGEYMIDHDESSAEEMSCLQIERDQAEAAEYLEQIESQIKGKQNEYIDGSAGGEWQRENCKSSQYEPSRNTTNTSCKEATPLPL